MSIKYRITKTDKECFFLRVGEIVILDFSDDRVYSEDRKQYMPISVAMKFGIDGEQVE